MRVLRVPLFLTALCCLPGCTAFGNLGAETGSSAGGEAPRLSRLDRSAFLPGERVVIYGSGFESPASRNLVRFEEAEAAAEQLGPGSLVVKVPSDARSGGLRVQSYGKLSQALPYLVDPPAIATLSATALPPGRTLIITGTHFSPVLEENRVSFNGTLVTPSLSTGEMLLVTVSGSPGPLTVSTGAGSSKPLDFVVIPKVGGSFNP